MCLDEFFSCFEKIATGILVRVPQIRQKPSCIPKTVLSILAFLRSKDLNGNRHFYFKSCFVRGDSKLSQIFNHQANLSVDTVNVTSNRSVSIRFLAGVLHFWWSPLLISDTGDWDGSSGDLC